MASVEPHSLAGQEGSSLPRTVAARGLAVPPAHGGNEQTAGCGRVSLGGLVGQHPSPARARLSSSGRCVGLTPTHVRLTPPTSAGNEQL